MLQQIAALQPPSTPKQCKAYQQQHCKKAISFSPTATHSKVQQKRLQQTAAAFLKHKSIHSDIAP